ncbi:hypothetical protein Plhal703r1_c42g0141781 [Plasmopara halstedii]
MEIMRMTLVQLRMRQTNGLAVYDFDSLRVAQIDGEFLRQNMSKVNKSKTLSLDEIKNIVARDIKLGSEHDNLSDTTYPNKYDDVTFQKTFKVQNSTIVALLMSINTSKESLILTLNAMCKMVKNRYRDAFGYYNTIRKELSKQNKAAKLDNELTPEEEKKYISYEELMSVLLAKAKRTDYLKLVFDYITLWLNVHYPLRLVWPSVMLTPEEGANYLQGNILQLNDFKNVRLMGPQTIQLDSTSMSLIKSYLEFLTDTVREQPSKLLWRIFNRQPGEYDYSSASNSFSQVISTVHEVQWKANVNEYDSTHR